jgi:hypothetical protein
VPETPQSRSTRTRLSHAGNAASLSLPEIIQDSGITRRSMQYSAPRGAERRRERPRWLSRSSN